MRTSEVRQGFNSRGKEKSMDVGSPARWFTDGLEKQAGTTVHAKVSSYRARLLLPRPGRRRCNKIGEKNNIHQRSNARKYYARSVKELSSSLSLSLSPSLFRSIRRFSTSHRSTFTPEIHPLPPRVYARAYKSTGVKALLLHASNENDIRANIPRRGFVDVHFHFNRSARGLVSLVFKCNAGWREGGEREDAPGKQLDLRNAFLSPLLNAFSTRFPSSTWRNRAADNSPFAIFETALYPPCPDSSSQREESIGSIL